MDKEQTIDRIKQKARRSFSSGYNCAECVAEAVFSEIETEWPSNIWKLATGFGGGIGLYGDACGALTGAVLSVSAACGRDRLPSGVDRHDTLARSREQLYEHPGLYRVFNQIPNWFAARFGHTLCRELTAPWQTQWLCREHALFCREIITEAAGFAAELILMGETERAGLRFRNTVERLDA